MVQSPDRRHSIDDEEIAALPATERDGATAAARRAGIDRADIGNLAERATRTPDRMLRLQLQIVRCDHGPLPYRCRHSRPSMRSIIAAAPKAAPSETKPGQSGSNTHDARQPMKLPALKSNQRHQDLRVNGATGWPGIRKRTP